MNTHDLLDIVETKLCNVADLNRGQLDRNDIHACIKSVEWGCPEFVEPRWPSWYTLGTAFLLGIIFDAIVVMNFLK
jgi:hypothetical protein